MQLKKIFKYILNFLDDPVGVKEYSTAINKSLYDIIKKIDAVEGHIERLQNNKSFDDIIKELEDERKKSAFYCMSLENIGDVIPDMIWMKWADTGEYAYANKAIKEELLFDTDPVGKTDITIGAAAVAKFGHSEHNFGEYCAGSDEIVIKGKVKKRFIEYGLSGGKPLILEVYKNVITDDTDGRVIATVGTGKDITHCIFTMLSAYGECGGCSKINENIDSFLEEYLFENTYSKETLLHFYNTHKDTYERNSNRDFERDI